MRLGYKDKLVMIGDSITDCERARPVGEGLFESIGKSYVAQVNGLLGAVYPELNLRVVNMGTSGNTVRDLEARWESDVLALQPDWLSILIGINDVWRQFDLPNIRESHVYIDEYEQTLSELVKQARPHVKGLVLMTPYYLETNLSDPMRATMDLYGAAVKRVAEANDCIYVDLQAEFDDLLRHVYSATLGWDRVHPTSVGHMRIARAFLKAVDFSWDGEATL